MLDPILAHRFGYLNAPFMLLRYVLFFALFSWVLRKLKPGEHRSEVGAWGLPLAFAAATFLTYDLFMALEAHFYSASFGAILLLSASLLALSVAVALAARRGTPALMGQAQNHTNLLLALSIIWIYVEATTLIIIWGADLPHEVEFYLKRLEGPWGTVAALWAVGGVFPALPLPPHQPAQAGSPLPLARGPLDPPLPPFAPGLVRASRLGTRDRTGGGGGLPGPILPLPLPVAGGLG